MSVVDSISENSSQLENTRVAVNLARNGYSVFPCDPATKHPVPGLKWTKEATSDPEKVAQLWRDWPNAMPALPTGAPNRLTVIDLDIRTATDTKPAKDGFAAYRAKGLDPDDAGMIVRTPSGGRHLYFDHRAGVRNSTSPDGIDVRGEGGYVIAPGAIAERGTYEISKGDLSISQMLGFSLFPAVMVEAKALLIAEQQAPGKYTIRELADPLFKIPNDGPHDDWVKILMALHYETGGSADGLNLAQAWSADYPNYDQKEVAAKWRSFGRKSGAPITGATLFAEARKHGWQAVGADAFDDLPDEGDAPGGTDAPPVTPDHAGLTFATPAECAASEPRPYVIKGLLAQRDIACVVGAPGVGKSLLAPRLAYAVAQGELIFARRVKQGGALYVAAEDEQGMRGRLRALHDELGDAPNLHLVSGVSDLLTMETVRLNGKNRHRCKQADMLAKAVWDHRPNLIVIDTLAMAFPGLEENSAEGMGRVVALARRLAKWGAAVILIHHDTKDGQQGLPRGHSLLNGALDVSVHLRKGDGGVVTGRLTKNRNGSCDLSMTFAIRTVEIGTDSDGDAVTAAIAEPMDRPPPRALSVKETVAFTVIERLAGDGAVVPEKAWREATIQEPDLSDSDKADSRRKAFREARDGLVRRQLVWPVEGGFQTSRDDGDDFEDLRNEDE